MRNNAGAPDAFLHQGAPTVQPPSTVSTVPVTNELASETTKTAGPTISSGLTLACKQGKLPGIDLTDITYYIGRETIIPRADIPGMSLWRESVFAFLQPWLR